MSETGADEPRKGLSRRTLALLIALLVAIAATGALLMLRPGSGDGLKSLARGEMSKLQVAEPPRPAPQAQFSGPMGEPRTLADFKGKVTVVNLWATWCAPCVKEMPTLAQLQEGYSGQPVEVVPISLDSDTAHPKARAFIARHKPLKYYSGPLSYAFGMDPPAPGLPTTLILDKQGRERARLSADADWSSPDAREVIDRLLAEG